MALHRADQQHAAQRLLERMVPVHKVHDLTVEGPHVERELTLVKINGSKKLPPKALKIAENFEARQIAAEGESIFEMTGTSKKVSEFLEQMRPFGITEMARSGVVAIARGEKQ